MKIRYTFRVEGTFRLAKSRDIVLPDQNAILTPVLSTSRILKALSLTFPLGEPFELPTFRASAEPSIAAEIEIPLAPHQDSASECARRIEAYLSPLGVTAIDTEQPGVKWIPESEEDRRRLSLISMSSEPGVPDGAHPVWRDAVLKKASRLPAPDTALHAQLGFFRSGWAQIKRFRYVEAYFLLFFFIEGLFGQGKIKTKPLEASFLASTELLNAILYAQAKRTSQRKQMDEWANLSAAEAVKKLITLRGFIAHNSSKRKEKWHPDEQSTHAADTMFLLDVATQIVTCRLWGERAEAMPAFPTVADEERLAFDRFLSN